MNKLRRGVYTNDRSDLAIDVINVYPTSTGVKIKYVLFNKRNSYPYQKGYKRFTNEEISKLDWY